MLKFTAACTNYLKATTSSFLVNKIDLLTQHQQTRNTFILKRRHPPGLHKKHGRPTLKSRHFVYDLIEDTNIKKKENIKVVLLKDIENFGPNGAIISVTPGKAYYKLLLPKLAVYANPENIEKYAKEDLSDQGSNLMSPTDLAQKFLSSLYLPVTMSANNEWTIQKRHIRISFRMIGAHVPEDAIIMPQKEIQGPNPDLELKHFYVTVKLNDTKTVKVRCILQYYSDDEDLSAREPLHHTPCIAIFPEDQEILDELPLHKLLEIEKKKESERSWKHIK